MSNVTSPIRMALLRWAKILQRKPTTKTQSQRPHGDLMEELHYQQCQDVAIKIDNELLERLKREGRDCCSLEELSDAISEEDAVKLQTKMYDAICEMNGAVRVPANEPMQITLTFHKDFLGESSEQRDSNN